MAAILVSCMDTLSFNKQWTNHTAAEWLTMVAILDLYLLMYESITALKWTKWQPYWISCMDSFQWTSSNPTTLVLLTVAAILYLCISIISEQNGGMYGKACHWTFKQLLNNGCHIGFLHSLPAWKFPMYLYQLNKRTRKTLLYGYVVLSEDTNHFLLHCPFFHEDRMRMFVAISLLGNFEITCSNYCTVLTILT